MNDLLELNPIYDLLWEGSGHAVGLSRMLPLSIAVACSCGWTTTWFPDESSKQVAGRFNRHLPVGHILFTGQVVSHKGVK